VNKKATTGDLNVPPLTVPSLNFFSAAESGRKIPPEVWGQTNDANVN
jgi:hypothetical protein